MVKTRSQTGNIAIKKEEKDVKPTLVLNGVSNTGSRRRIATRTPHVTNNRRLPALQVKVEEDTDIKSLLQLVPNSSKRGSIPRISQEQINQLIHYIVNDNMSVNKASQKVNISLRSGCIYYNIYKRDSEKRIPVSRHQCGQSRIIYTQEQVENLIRYISDDKMTITEASVKTNMTYTSAYYYYNRYLKDPNHAIPIPESHHTYTKDQKSELIAYIVRDKMSITAASEKAKMGISAAQRFYHKYFKKQNPDIARPSHIITPTRYTQEQIKEVINYIVDDKMSIAAASRKANVCSTSAGKYCRQYLKDNSTEVPVGETSKRYTQDEINEFIGYVVDGKMSIKAASEKANMASVFARMYHQKYLKKQNLSIPSARYKQDRINEFIGYIVDDKMTIKAASTKANFGFTSGCKYYRQYLKNQKRDTST